MQAEYYTYTFTSKVALEEVEGALLLATFAVESLHGEAQVHLDAAHEFDAGARMLTVDATTAVGRDLNRVFCGFLRRELDHEHFRVAHVPGRQPQPLCPA